MNLKNVINRLINKFGYDIKSLAHDSGIRKTIAESYSLLRQLDFQPKTIIDVGVASGTPELYRTFADSYFLLIEPLKEFETDIIAILERYSGSYVLAVEGSKTGQVTFNVYSNHLSGSSIYKESKGRFNRANKPSMP